VKNCSLVIEAWSHVRVQPTFKSSAQAMAHHVVGVHAFGRVGVVRTAGRVNVMVAGIPAKQGRIDQRLTSYVNSVG